VFLDIKNKHFRDQSCFDLKRKKLGANSVYEILFYDLKPILKKFFFWRDLKNVAVLQN
jgi:hypothetical protein